MDEVDDLIKWLEDNLNRSCALQISHPHLAWKPTEKDRQRFARVKELLRACNA